MSERFKGTIKWFNAEKQFGFIVPDEQGKDVFLHLSGVKNGVAPSEDDKVEFKIIKAPKGNQAIELEVTEASRSKPHEATGPQTPPPSPKASARIGRKPIPYTFVPIQVSKAIDDNDNCPSQDFFDVPGHDGRKAKERFSGRLKLTLTTHTPLLVGNRHFKIGEKSVVTPWQLTADGPVLLAGSSLKGMLRHHMSALLNAPMEKVYEQYFSYRPNLKMRTGNQKLEFREAVIIEGPDDPNGKMKVRLLNPGRNAMFVRNEVLEKNPIKPGFQLKTSSELRNAKQDAIYNRKFKKSVKQMRLVKDDKGSWRPNIDYLVCAYHGGISGLICPDQKGVFTLLHDANNQKENNKAPNIKLYDTVLVPAGQGKEIEIDAAIVHAYRLTQQELADVRYGHSSARNPIVGSQRNPQKKASSSLESAKNLELLKPNTLIYVEVDKNNNVVSFGHHFRYRWGYRDTLRVLNRAGQQSRPRPEVSVQPDENVGKSDAGYEGKLTAARALFGYAADKDLHGDKFTDDFARLAGRLTFNHAIEIVEEVVEKKETNSERFVTHGPSEKVPLKELASPKSSAVEFYVQQNPEDNASGRLTTYGDLTREAVNQEAEKPSRLSGRKFYRHQPQAATDSSVYIGDRINTRAAYAHRASRPGRRFKVSLRYQDLTEYELGALLFVLGIHQTNAFLSGKEPDNETTALPDYALKLGYARPLGWGSVTFALEDVDKITHTQDTGELSVKRIDLEQVSKWRNDYVKKFLESLKGQPGKTELLETCLQAWRFKGAAQAEYPNIKGEVFKFHSDLRGRHSVARRLADNEARPITEPSLAYPAYGKKKND